MYDVYKYLYDDSTHFIEHYNASIKRRPPLLKLTHIKLVTPIEIDYKTHRRTTICGGTSLST